MLADCPWLRSLLVPLTAVPEPIAGCTDLGRCRRARVCSLLHNLHGALLSTPPTPLLLLLLQACTPSSMTA